MRESEREKLIRIELSKQNLVAWRNNVGHGWVATRVQHFRDRGYAVLRNPRPIHFGLAVGSSDEIGYYSLIVTPEMVGKKIAVFAAVECKSATGRLSEEQKNFLSVLKDAGAIAFVAKTAADVIEGLNEWLHRITTK